MGLIYLQVEQRRLFDVPTPAFVKGYLKFKVPAQNFAVNQRHNPHAIFYPNELN